MIDNVRKFKEDAGKLVKKLKDYMRSVWNSIKSTAVSIWTTVSEKVTEFAEAIRSVVSSKITKLRRTLHNIWTTIQSKALSVWETITVDIPAKVESMRQAVVDWIETLRLGLKRKWDLIYDKAVDIWETIKTNTIDKVKNMWTRITKYAESIKDKFVGAFEGIRDGIKKPINVVISFINGLIDGVVTGINAVSDTLNKLSFSIPEWVPKFGGATFGLNISRITNYPQIPELAKGAVIPPNAPFLAELGDQKKGTNIEAPLDTIKQAVQEAGGSNRPIHIQMYLDGRVVYETFVNQAKKQQQMTGRPPFEFA